MMQIGFGIQALKRIVKPMINDGLPATYTLSRTERPGFNANPIHSGGETGIRESTSSEPLWESNAKVEKNG